MAIEYEGPDHLSVSQVHSIQDCSWHWFLERVARVPRAPAWYLVGGKAVHAATEEIDKADDLNIDYPMATQLFARHWDAQLAEEVDNNPDFPPATWRAAGRVSKAWPGKENDAWWLSNGPTMVMNWVTWRLNNPAWEIANIGGSPAVEAEIAGSLGNTRLPLLGYIDRILFNAATGAYMVLDLKTGSRTPGDTMQLGTYSLYVELLYGIRPQWGAYWMARTGITSTPVDLINEWPKERLLHELQQAERAIQGPLSCNPGQGFCGPGCNLAGHCYACGGIRPGIILPWEVEIVLPSSSTAA